MISAARRASLRRAMFVVPGLMAVCAALAPTAGAAATSAQKITLSLEKQTYAIEAPADPYQGDGTTIHAGVTGTSPTDKTQHDYARSFVKVALDRLPAESAVGSVVVTLEVLQKADAPSSGVYQTYQVNETAALLQACPLKAPIPDKIDSTHPEPAYDCATVSVVGTPPPAGGSTWTFDMSPLVKVWAAAGNTGAAILPVASDASSTWVVSFATARSSSIIGYVPAPVVAPPAPPGHTVPPAYYRVPVTVTKPYPFPSTAPAPVANPPVNSAPEVAPPTASATPAGFPAWMWVLPACLTLAALLMALAHRPALAATGAPLKVRVFMDMRSHPRSYAVASIVSAWGLLFATYSAVVAPARTQVASRNNAAAPQEQGPASSQSNATNVAPGPQSSTSYQTLSKGGGFVPGDEFKGPGTYKTIGDIRVFFPANGGPPVADLYKGADDVAGIDFANKTIALCGHAALTFGPAFSIDTTDINVFWKYLNTHGGIDGWKFKVGSTDGVQWYDDGYDPGKALTAAANCKSNINPFLMLGGIGFDQIPTVRNFAETNKMLYLHHIVTTAGSQGLKYSFTALPSEEQMGLLAGRLATEKFKGKKIGIIWRDSANWQSGHDLFVKTVKAAGMTIVGDYRVGKNQGTYTQEVSGLSSPTDPSKRADVVFCWENALYTTDIVQAAQGQAYHPAWILFPFNLELATLGDTALDQDLYGIAAWDAYDPGVYNGAFGSYANLIHDFETQYHAEGDDGLRKGPNNPQGNDLLFLSWEGFAGLADLFRQCLPQCTRNRMAGILLTYHKLVPGFCDSDFTKTDGHHGGWVGNYFHAERDPKNPAGKAAAWIPYSRCAPVG